MLSVELRKKLDGISKCSIKGQHKVKNLFKILTNNLELWDWAHQEIASNKGATTRGVDDVTVDGYSDEGAIALMELLNQGKYQPQPVRRTYIPKANGKQRPLGIPNDHDKLVQSACKILLEAIYEPVFHEHSYGLDIVLIGPLEDGVKTDLEFLLEIVLGILGTGADLVTDIVI